MDTLTEDPATLEPVTDTPTPEQPEGTDPVDTPAGGKQEDAATLHKRLADKDRYIKDLEAKTKKEKPDTRSDEIKELEWKIENKDRITLVKDEFEKILAEGYQGESVSKKIALELAEKLAKVDHSGTKRERMDDMTTPSVTTRNSSPKGYEDELDERLNLTIEKKRKLEERHPHLKQS
jgi:hypothetical protein